MGVGNDSSHADIGGAVVVKQAEGNLVTAGGKIIIPIKAIGGTAQESDGEVHHTVYATIDAYFQFGFICAVGTRYVTINGDALTAKGESVLSGTFSSNVLKILHQQLRVHVGKALF